MKFLFYLPSKFGDAVKDFDYPEKFPMGGSETAALKLAQALQNMGHQAKIVTTKEECQNHDCEVFIAVRDLEIFLQIPPNPHHLTYLWCHDDVDQAFLQPLLEEKVADFIFSQCDAIIVPSHYASNNWAKHFKVPLSKLEMIPNGISLPLFEKIDFEEVIARPPHAYYASTPQRGLSELTQAWPNIVKKIPDAHLYIASSMKVYNSSEENAVQKIIENAKALPNATYLGALNQKELRDIAKKCRALAYPCTFAETGCIAALEALASGCAVVSTSRGALPETAWRNPLVEPHGDWLNLWTHELIKIFTDNAYYLSFVKSNAQIIPWMDWKIITENYWLQRIKSDRAAKRIPSS